MGLNQETGLIPTASQARELIAFGRRDTDEREDDVLAFFGS